jgi:hypothetical protein
VSEETVQKTEHKTAIVISSRDCAHFVQGQDGNSFVSFEMHANTTQLIRKE